MELVAQTALSNISYNTISHRWYLTQSGGSYYDVNNNPQLITVKHHSEHAYVTGLSDSFSSTRSYWVSAVIDGCESSRKKVSATINSIPRPQFSSSGNTSEVCIQDTDFYLEVPGNYDNYTWFRDGTQVLGGLGNNARLYLTRENGLSPGAYTYSVRVRDISCNQYITEELPALVTVKGLISNTISISGSTLFCAGESTTFTATTNPALRVSLQWNVNGTPVSGEHGTQFTFTNAMDGDQVTCTATVSGGENCVNTLSKTSTSKTVTVKDIPPSPTTWGVTSDCGPKDMELVAETGLSNISYTTISHRWYLSQSGDSYYDANNSQLVNVKHHSSNAYVTGLSDFFSSNDTYWVAVVIDGCESPRQEVSATVNSIPRPQFSSSGNTSEVCIQDTDFYLEVPGNYDNYTWFRDGTQVLGGLGNNARLYLTRENGLSPGAYTYSVRVRDISCNQYITEELPALVTVKGLISNTISISGSTLFCAGESTTFTATTNPALRVSLQWNVNGTPVSGEHGTQFTFTNAMDGDQVTCTATVSGGENCVNTLSKTSTSKTVTVKDIPPSPTTWGVTSDCGPEDMELVAETGLSNISYNTISHRWYFSEFGDNFYDANNSQLVNVKHHSSNAYVTGLRDFFSSNITYWVAVVIDGCESPRSPVQVIINDIGRPFVSASGNPMDVCNTDTDFYLEVIGNYGSYEWFKDGIRVADAQNNNARLYPTLESGLSPGTYTYSVKVRENTCNEYLTEPFASPVTIVTAEHTPSISIEKPTTNVVRYGRQLTLKAVAQHQGVGSIYQWYNNGSPVGSNTPNYTITSTLGDGSYSIYCTLTVTDGSCVTQRVVSSETVDIEVNTGFNYIETRGYDELEEAAAGIIYFDDDGKPLQQQTKTYSGNQALPGTRVIISSTLRDAYDREVLTTLPMPTDRTAFEYMPDFIRVETPDNDGDVYSYIHFDEGIKRLHPDPMEKDVANTLNWYYSNNNTFEEHVPTTSYPYSRIEYYDDGTGETKRSAGPGEAHRLGSGYEVYSRTFEVSSELDHYVQLRNRILGTVGPNTMANQAIQSVVIDENNNITLSFSDRAENVLMTAKAGDWWFPNNIQFSLETGNGTFYTIDQRTINASSPLRITGVKSGNVVYDGAGTNIPGLDPGFYQVDNGGVDLTISPTHGFGDIAYNFYDDAGRLIVSIAPKGVKEIVNSNIDLLDPDSLSYATYYKYNHQGWLLSTHEPDAGVTHYQYRKDGSIRFSQNEQQRIREDFSYTDYDKLGRPIESGEYIGTAVTFGSGTNSILENTGFNNWPDADKKSWVKTHYDTHDDNFTTITGLSEQDFVMGAVSWTENEHITTWYSYDEQGRVTWMAQKPKSLANQTFLITYDYDFLGNVLQVSFTSYRSGTPGDQFYHYYTYDADKRLSSVYTSLNGNLNPATLETNAEAQLQAHYQYYLHGPLKRIELGGNLQGLDFVYNINGWLKQINHPDVASDPGGDGNNGFNEDAFGMLLNYYENNMSNLFNVSANTRPQPELFHGLPGETAQTAPALANLFEVLNPDYKIESYFKQHSAEQPKYHKMLNQLKNNPARAN